MAFITQYVIFFNSCSLNEGPQDNIFNYNLSKIYQKTCKPAIGELHTDFVWLTVMTQHLRWSYGILSGA